MEEFKWWEDVKTSAARLEAIRKRRGSGLQTPNIHRSVPNKLQKTNREAKALKILGTFKVLHRPAEKKFMWRKRNSHFNLKDSATRSTKFRGFTRELNDRHLS